VDLDVAAHLQQRERCSQPAQTAARDQHPHGFEYTSGRLRYFPREGPASAIVEVSRLALPELLIEIEIEAVAALPL
jgi:enamine deaminase RidA (YjgF/YER057c/UK114 family)